MKILLLITFITIAPAFVMAQRTTLGQSKEEFRMSIKPNSGLRILKGESSDTVDVQGIMKLVMYYKKDTCYASSSTLPMEYKKDVIKKMTDDAYQKVNETTWIDRTKTIKVVVTDTADKKQFTVVDTWLDQTKNR